MRTKFSTVSGDDQSQHHSGINKIVKIYLYTQNTEQFIVLSHTHTHPIQTVTQFKNIIHPPLWVKKQKNLHSTTLFNTHSDSSTSKYSLVRTKFSTVSDDDQSHHHSGINKIVKIYLYIQNTEQFIVLSHTLTHFKQWPNSKTLSNHHFELKT